jgi:hypothetical protein
MGKKSTEARNALPYGLRVNVVGLDFPPPSSARPRVRPEYSAICLLFIAHQFK